MGAYGRGVRDRPLLSVSSHFFFQAEDGIRDPLWSRGLGDVYKRQREKRAITDPTPICTHGVETEPGRGQGFHF